MRIRLPSKNTGGPASGWLGAFVLAAIGLWCTNGLLDVVGGSTGPVRIAMLPPWWLLAVGVIAFGALGAALARTGRSADTVRPLCALGLLAFPFLPWLPDYLPILRAAAGPARPLLWLVVLWLIAVGASRSFGSRLRISPSPRRIFLAGVLVFGIAASGLTNTPLFPGGDEPHYLVITQSLLRDGDLRIEDNHQRQEYRAYFNRDLRPDYLARGVDGQIYSVHPIGLSVLALPPFALGGYRGVVAMQVLMAALAAALLWQWTYRITGSAASATFGWAAAALTGPFLFNSFTVYPEIPAALAVMVVMAWRSESTAPLVLIARGAAIGALPWLSTKYAPMAAVLTLIVLLRIQPNWPAMATFVAPIACAFMAWFSFFFWIWGTPSPSAPYGSSEPMTLATLARGGPGLLFDQEYGVIAYAPILLVALAGLAQMLRSGGVSARRALEVLAVFGALLGTVGAFHLWWGGTAAPGRPVASGILLLGVPIASLMASATTSPATRAACHVLLGASLAIGGALAAVQGGAFLNNDRNGTSALLEWISPSWPISTAFPSFIAGGWTDAAIRTFAWLGLAAAIVWLVNRLAVRSVGAAFLATLAFGTIGGVSLVTLGTSAMALPAALGPEARARVPLLDRFDTGRRPAAILYDPFSRLSGEHALSMVELVARPGLRTAPQPVEVLWNARFALPAGEYRVRLTRNADGPLGDTTLAPQIGRVGPPLEEWPVTGPIWEQRLVLPIDALFVGFRAPPELAKSEGELRIVPVRIVDESKRVSRPPVLGARRYGALTAFFHDDVIVGEPGGYWTRGKARTEVTYAADASAPPAIDVVVQCGPVANRITLGTSGWRETLALQPGETRQVAIPTVLEPGLSVRIAALRMDVEGAFIPAELDPAATDRRVLGCWIDMQTL